MSMTLEQVRDALRIFGRNGTIGLSVEKVRKWANAIDAHLARQSDGPSDEDVETALVAFSGDPDWEEYSTALEMNRKDMLAALTAVWHNRPAQEKAEPVAWIDTWTEPHGEQLSEVHFEKPRIVNGTLMPLYTAPPTERVRVPDGWIDRHQIAAGECPPKSMVVLVGSIRRMLSAAPEADHD